MALMISETVKDSAFSKPMHLDQQVLTCLRSSVAVYKNNQLFCPCCFSQDSIKSTQTVDCNFFPSRLSLSRNWKILSLKETDAVNPIMILHFVMQDSSSWQLQSLEFSRNQLLGDVFTDASDDAVSPRFWSYISPTSQNYLSTATVSSISTLACLLQLRFTFQQRLELLKSILAIYFTQLFNYLKC